MNKRIGLISLFSSTAIWVGILAMTTIISCKSDVDHVYASDSEEQYYEDYEPPRFKWGMVNFQGEILVSPKYDDIKDAINPKFIAANLGGKWGFIDSIENIVIPFQFKSVSNFSESKSWVQGFDNSWRILSIDGTVSDTLQIQSSKEFSLGIAPVQLDGIWQYVDTEDKVAFNAKFVSAEPFDPKSKHAIVKSQDGYGVIDRSGKTIVPTQYSRISTDAYGYVVKQNGRYTYLDMSGKPRHNTANYSKAHPYTYNKTVVQSNEKWLGLDQNGKLIAELPYKQIIPLDMNMWKYQVDSLWGILDADFKQISSPIFQATYNYEEGMLGVKQNAKWGFVNANGEPTIPCQYSLVWSFKESVARVLDDGLIKAVDSEGTFLPNIVFVELRDFNNGLARFQNYPILQ